VEDYIRGCSTSTKYCYPWTSWRLYQRVFYFYQILSPLNKLKTISCSRATVFGRSWTPSDSLQIIQGWQYFVEVVHPLSVLLLPNTVALKQVEDYIRGCSTSTKYCYPWTSWRLYQRVFYFYHTLWYSLQLVQGRQYLVEVEVLYFYQILSPLNELKTISEGVLLLPNTVPVKRTEDYIRGWSTSSKYCPHYTLW
jgi:hypothetical protein